MKWFAHTARKWKDRGSDLASLDPKCHINHHAVEIPTSELPGQYVFGGSELGSVEGREAVWIWSQSTWAQVPAPATCIGTDMCQAGETVRHPNSLAPGREEWASKDPEGFQMGMLSGWSWGCE